jgi:hypothetical protein
MTRIMASITTHNTFVRQYSRNLHSQNGEDGVLYEICQRLGLTPEWVCEFGAWDGIHLSNTFQYVERGANAVLIEGDPEKYLDLLTTHKRYPKIQPICAMVSSSNPRWTLDALLERTNIPTDFDILSIDIDSEDYQVWKSLKTYKPKIVVIEINSEIHPQNNEYIHSPEKGCQGTGFGPTLELGTQKGYTFVCHTGNMIFVRSDLFPKLGITYNHPLEHFNPSWYIHAEKRKQTESERVNLDSDIRIR